MKPFSLLVAAAAIVGFSGAASAEKPDDPGCFGQDTAEAIPKLVKEGGGPTASELELIVKRVTDYREGRECPAAPDPAALVIPD